MASPIPCANDHGAPADLVLTNTNDGDTYGVCSACAPATLRAIADTIEQSQRQPLPDDVDEAPTAPEQPSDTTGQSNPAAPVQTPTEEQPPHTPDEQQPTGTPDEATPESPAPAEGASTAAVVL
jgi:hypothetical protein